MNRRRGVSLEFVSAMIGFAITILAWFGPWHWPAWPAMVILETAFSPVRPFSALSYGARSVVIVLLIAVNVAAWGTVTWPVLRWISGGPSSLRS